MPSSISDSAKSLGALSGGGDYKDGGAAHTRDVEAGSAEDYGSPRSRSFFQRFLDEFRPVEIALPPQELTRQQRAIFGTTTVPLRRALKPRHLQMIAIGGSIGAGLFVGSGNALKNGGPGGMLIGYIIVGLFLFLTMTALGELAVRYPVAGVFSAYNSRFIDHSWGFAVGWNYTISWLLSLPTELVAASVTIGFWKGDDNGATHVNKAAWVALFWGVIAGINVFGVRGYGEAEVIFSSVKVLAVVGFIIFAIIITAGGGPHHHYYGTHYYHDPGSFPHGAKGVFKVLVTAAYAFSGTELSGLAAAETADAHRAVPRAVKQVFWRILLFYVVSIVMIGCLVPYNNKRLGLTSDGSSSPFVIAIQNAGVHALPSILNVCILLAVLSVGNSAIFASSRTFVSLAAQGHAPRFVLWIDRHGRPVFAVLTALVFGLIGFVSATPKYPEAFNWLSALGGLSGILTWISINACHIRNRKALRLNGIEPKDLEYAAPLGIYGSVVAIVLGIFILAVNFWVALFPIGKGASAESFFQTWLSACIILALFAGHKLWFRDPLVRTKDIDVYTGARIKDADELRRLVAEERAYVQSRNIFYRTYRFWC